MKKILLSVAAIFAAMSLNAQEVVTFNADNALGLDADNGTTLTAGTVIGESESITATIGADDSHKPQDVKFAINGTEYQGGLQGNTNPKDADGASSNASLKAPVSGAYLQFEAKADGILYVIHKASANKAYTVFEDGTPIGYTFAAIGDAATVLGEVYQFELKGEGEYNEVKNPVEFAEREYLKVANPEEYAKRLSTETQEDGTVKETWELVKNANDKTISGVGVLKFPVYKGIKYVVNASGSKITAAGYVFSTEDNVLIQSDDIVIYKGEGAAEPVQKVYSVIGTLNGNWDKDDDMVKDDEGNYIAVFENVAAGEYKFKVRQDHDWAVNWGNGDDGDGNTVFTVEKDGSTVYIVFNPAGEGTLEYKVEAPEEPAGEEIVLAEGSWTVNGWADQPSFLSDGGAELTEAGAEAGDIIRIYASAPDTNWQFELFDGHWHNNYQRFSEVALTNEDGSARESIVVPLSTQGYVDFTITADFLTAATTSEGWGGAFLLNGDGNLTVTKIALVKGGSTGINAVKAVKADGAIYNLAGQKVNASYKGVVIINGKKYIQK